MELGVTASSKPLGKVTAAELLPPLSILPSNQLIFSFFPITSLSFARLAVKLQQPRQWQRRWLATVVRGEK